MSGLGSLLKSKTKSKGKTEEQLLAQDSISKDDVMRLTKATDNYLCKPSDNSFGIEFTAFKLRDIDHNATLFEVAKPEGVELEQPEDNHEDGTGRFVDYSFNSQFLRLRNVGATVTFCIGDQPVQDFHMIERHFFKDRLLKSFNFEFGFCIPDSVNTCEHIYEFPALSETEISEMIDNPGATKSDSFYFVEGKLVMHNRAQYAYTVDES